MKDVPRLARLPLKSDDLWKKTANGTVAPDMRVLREYFLGEGQLEKRDLMRIMHEMCQQLRKEPNTA